MNLGSLSPQIALSSCPSLQLRVQTKPPSEQVPDDLHVRSYATNDVVFVQFLSAG